MLMRWRLPIEASQAHTGQAADEELSNILRNILRNTLRVSLLRGAGCLLTAAFRNNLSGGGGRKSSAAFHPAIQRVDRQHQGSPLDCTYPGRRLLRYRYHPTPITRPRLAMGCAVASSNTSPSGHPSPTPHTSTNLSQAAHGPRCHQAFV